jgi:hypothetical protein
VGKWIVFFSLVAYTAISAHNSLNYLKQEPMGWKSAVSLPQEKIDAHFAHVQGEIEERWKLAGAGQEFSVYVPDRQEESLIEEFYLFHDLRTRLWFKDPSQFPCESNPLFTVSQEHFLTGRFRQPNCITFEHTATDPSYNSSSIQVGTRRFFAFEGPREEFVPDFFRLLINWDVASLVCLTDMADEKGSPKCFPYWKGRTTLKDSQVVLRVPVVGQYEWKEDAWGVKEIPYLHLPDWKDHHGISAEDLVKAIHQVRQGLSERDIVAVHCSAGVGRTGTFIAAFCLLEAIDEQLAKGVAPSEIRLSIPQLFLYLSLHRPWLVARPSQYVTLYRTVDWYLNKNS